MIDSIRFQNGSLMLVKNKTTDDVWSFRYYEQVDGKRVHRNRKIGSVREYPRRRDAEKAVLSLRSKINSEVRSPETVNDLITHYLKHELTLERKEFATVDVNSRFLRLYVAAKWGTHTLSEVRTVAFEEWLDSLPYAPATKAKIRNVTSAIYSHGIRYEWITFNPITKVRCSAKRLREPDILTPGEFLALTRVLSLQELAMVMVIGSTGLRRSEMFALKWMNIDFQTMEIAITRKVVRNRFGKVKTVASGKPVALHQPVYDALTKWRGHSLYPEDGDFLFPSIRLKGAKPLTPDMVLKNYIRPALLKAGISGKVVGWHSFRHSIATNLRTLGEDVKVAQEILRHANSRTTLDLYTQAVSAEKRRAGERHMDMLMAG